jgi:hypothetical protein
MLCVALPSKESSLVQSWQDMMSTLVHHLYHTCMLSEAETHEYRSVMVDSYGDCFHHL